MTQKLATGQLATEPHIEDWMWTDEWMWTGTDPLIFAATAPPTPPPSCPAASLDYVAARAAILDSGAHQPAEIAPTPNQDAVLASSAPAPIDVYTRRSRDSVISSARILTCLGAVTASFGLGTILIMALTHSGNSGWGAASCFALMFAPLFVAGARSYMNSPYEMCFVGPCLVRFTSLRETTEVFKSDIVRLVRHDRVNVERRADGPTSQSYEVVCRRGDRTISRTIWKEPFQQLLRLDGVPRMNVKTHEYDPDVD